MRWPSAACVCRLTGRFQPGRTEPGAGIDPPAVLVHGTLSWGSLAFDRQRPLAAYRRRWDDLRAARSASLRRFDCWRHLTPTPTNRGPPRSATTTSRSLPTSGRTGSRGPWRSWRHRRSNSICCSSPAPCGADGSAISDEFGPAEFAVPRGGNHVSPKAA